MQTALENVKALKASTAIYGGGAGGSSSVAYEDVQLPRLSSLKRSTPDSERKNRGQKRRPGSPSPKVKQESEADSERRRRLFCMCDFDLVLPLRLNPAPVASAVDHAHGGARLQSLT